VSTAWGRRGENLSTGVSAAKQLRLRVSADTEGLAAGILGYTGAAAPSLIDALPAAIYTTPRTGPARARQLPSDTGGAA
jgi:hypothetical protein